VVRSASNVKVFWEKSLHDKFLCFAEDHGNLSAHANPRFFSSENCVSSHLVAGTVCLHLVISVGKEMVICPAVWHVVSLLAGSIPQALQPLAMMSLSSIRPGALFAFEKQLLDDGVNKETEGGAVFLRV